MTFVLAARKVRSIKQTGGLGPWEFEVGEPERKDDNELVMESTSNPIFVRKDTPSHFQWRVRNLPYPVSGDHPEIGDRPTRQTVISYRQAGMAHSGLLCYALSPQ